MIVGRCSLELSGRNPRRKIKKSQTPSEADLSRRPVEGICGSTDFSWKCFVDPQFNTELSL
jgi:hypothetical protein